MARRALDMAEPKAMAIGERSQAADEVPLVRSGARNQPSRCLTSHGRSAPSRTPPVNSASKSKHFNVPIHRTTDKIFTRRIEPAERIGRSQASFYQAVPLS